MNKLLLTIACIAFTPSLLAQNIMQPELLWQLKRNSLIHSDGQHIIYGEKSYNTKDESSKVSYFSYSLKNGRQTSDLNQLGSDLFFGNEAIYYNKDGKIMKNANGKESLFVDADLHDFKVSPNEAFIAFVKPTEHGDLPKTKFKHLPQANALMTDDLMYRHWDHYNDESVNHIFVAEISSNLIQRTTDLQEGQSFEAPLAPFHGTEDFVWNKNNELVYVEKSKTGKDFAVSTNSDIYIYNMISKVKTCISCEFKGYDTNPVISPDGSKIAFLSMARDGYESDKNRLMIYDLKNKKNTDISANFNETISSISWKGNKTLLSTVPYLGANQVFEFDLDQKSRQITSEAYNHNSVQTFGAYLLISRQDMNHASDLYLYDPNKKVYTNISQSNKDIYDQLTMPSIRSVWVPTHDGKQMLVWEILPPNFDSTKQYPALLYCQGGPQGMVSQFYSFRWNFQLMASQGYVIIAPNRRGLPGFGLEWNEEISKNWGGNAIQDYMTASDYFAQKDYIDEKRIGAIGASYGGYSVYMLAGVHENRYKTFISHCGLFNLESWYLTTEEMFFANWDIGGPYWEAEWKSAYEKNSPHHYAQNWNTPIMVIHGANDFRVPLEQGLQAYQLAQLKGIKSRLLLFHNEGHWVLRPQNGLLWHQGFFDWLKETL